MNRKRTDYLVLHCAATRAIQDIGAAEIREMHTARPPRGRGWTDIGYALIIRRNGVVENGRSPLDAVGAHVAGHNHHSLGICLVGGLNNDTWAPEDNFTPAQWQSLKRVVADLLERYPGATILGHRDFPKVKKACPCFNARAWARRNGFPAAPTTLS